MNASTLQSVSSQHEKSYSAILLYCGNLYKSNYKKSDSDSLCMNIRDKMHKLNQEDKHFNEVVLTFLNIDLEIIL